jgi:hypothetical protein
MTIGSWFATTEKSVLGWFTNEDKALLEFFGPVMHQVKTEAIKLGKGELKVGLNIIKDAAIASAIAAATAPAGMRVALAEKAFVQVGTAEGLTELHNAGSAAIKAAVAIVQTQTPVTVSAAMLAPALAFVKAETGVDVAAPVANTVQ